MSKRQVVSLKEIERAQLKAKKRSQKTDLNYLETIKSTKVRTKHPVKRTIIFICGMISGTFSVLAFLDASYLVGFILGGLSLFFFYVSFFGDRTQLSECIMETGDSALDAVTNISFDI